MPLTLQELKELLPVPGQCSEGGAAFEYFWHYELPVQPHQFWPYISDSSRMNREVGYEEVRYREIDGELHGQSGSGRMLQEWIEYPFEWNYPVFIRRLRKYSKGIPRYNFIQGYLEPTPGGCIAYIHNVVNSDHPMAARLLPRYLEPFGERYRRTFARAVEAIQQSRPIETVYPPNRVTLKPDGQSILDDGLRWIRERGYSGEEIRTLRDFILNSDRELLHRIRPLALDGFDPDPRRRTGLFLQGVLAGLFTMNYEVICPHCRGSRVSKGSLAEVPVKAECHVCEIEFENGRDDSLELTFRLHPSIGDTAPSFFCAAEPARKTHVRIQRMIPRGPDRFAANLPPGRYRFLLQRQQLPLAGEFHRGSTSMPGMNGYCELENPFGTRALLMVEEPDTSRNALNPSILFSTQEFRDLFAGEQLSAELQIDIGRQTIAFVDIVGSTRFYEERGDGKAFQEVKRHFEHLFSIVQRQGGTVIKTIGDGMMLCFPSPLHGLRAALEAVAAYDDPMGKWELDIRVTLNTGPCLAVNFNTGVDFFGHTVNLAAKLQSVAASNEVAVSQSVFDQPGVQSHLKERGLQYSKRFLEGTGLKQNVTAFVFSP
jgi:class 3 adenylate cyclase